MPTAYNHSMAQRQNRLRNEQREKDALRPTNTYVDFPVPNNMEKSNSTHVWFKSYGAVSRLHLVWRKPNGQLHIWSDGGYPGDVLMVKDGVL